VLQEGNGKRKVPRLHDPVFEAEVDGTFPEPEFRN
jgi:hypothetical protein